MRYPALIDGQTGGYGVAFPDLPGCVAMGSTVDEAIENAEDALRDWIDSMKDAGHPVAAPSVLETISVPQGSALTLVTLAPLIAQTRA